MMTRCREKTARTFRSADQRLGCCLIPAFYCFFEWQKLLGEDSDEASELL